MKEFFAVLSVLVVIALIVAVPLGWGLNIVRLFGMDFKAPYKEEVIRVIGIPFAPIGVVAGYIDFEEDAETNG